MRLTLADNSRLLALALAVLLAAPAAFAQVEPAAPVDAAPDKPGSSSETVVPAEIDKARVSNDRSGRDVGTIVRGSLTGSALLDGDKLYDTQDPTDAPHIQRPLKNGDTATTSDPYDDMGLPPQPSYAKDLETPPQLNTLMNQRPSEEDPAEVNGRKMRLRAISEAAMSYGARGGLARRTWEIRQQLSRHANDLDRAFNFRQLLIAAPSGLLIEPPIVTESEQNTLIADDGQEAAVADTMLKISREARIVSASRDWRTYLERDWGKVDSPPDVLLPKEDDEEIVWAKAVATGWDEGYKQADEIFQSDIDRMSRDYVGMVRYRYLLAHNMISAPYALQQDNGVTGGGSEMRIGDRAVAITGQSQLQARPEAWQPIPR